MSNSLNGKDFGSKIYNRFPPKYREDDVNQQYALKRYLESIAEGGFSHSIDEIKGLTSLIDPNNVDAKVLPILFKQHGLDVFNGIPEDYLRRLLPNLGEAWSKKGSLDVLEFITSSLSGIRTKTDVSYDKDGNPLIDVRLEMDSNLGDYFPDVKQFNRILDKFLPFYSDKTLIYSYVFDDIANVDVDENDFVNITHNPENEDISPIPTEDSLDTLKLNSEHDSPNLKTNEVETLMSVKQTFVDSSNYKSMDECVNTISQTSKTNARFYTGVFGKAVFNDSTFDKHTTVIT